MSSEPKRAPILRAATVLGAASITGLALSLIRIKVAAVIVGPAGVGLIGLMTTLVAAASVVASLGFGSAGTRQIAEAVGKNDPSAVAAARSALWWGSLVLAVLGGLVFWSLREVLAKHVLGSSSYATEAGILAFAVTLTVVSTAQTAVLTGLRDISAIARLTILSSLSATVIAVFAMRQWGTDGAAAFVIAIPLSSCLWGYVYVRRTRQVGNIRVPLSDLMTQLRPLTALGTAFMLAALAGSAGQLAMRSLIQSELGLDAIGHFHAVALVSTTYITFVTAAMGSDLYPRLAGAISDAPQANRMVNEQTEMSLLLAGPVLLLTIGGAPWILEYLYSRAFSPAADLLRLQVVADVLKLASWPLGFLILAAGDGRKFMFSETFGMLILIATTWACLPFFGLLGAGIAYCVMYGLYLPLLFWLARKRTGFRWNRSVVKIGCALLLACVTVCWVGFQNATYGAWAGLIAAGAFGTAAFSRFRDIGLPSWLGGRPVTAQTADSKARTGELK